MMRSLVFLILLESSLILFLRVFSIQVLLSLENISPLILLMVLVMVGTVLVVLNLSLIFIISINFVDYLVGSPLNEGLGDLNFVHLCELSLSHVRELVHSHHEGKDCLVLVMLLYIFIILLEDLIFFVRVLFGGIGLAVFSNKIDIGT